MNTKSKCCEKYLKKAKLCKGCPLLEKFCSKDRRRLSKKARKRLAKAA